MREDKRENKKGFTLVEMLIVIAITAMLSGLAIVYSHIGQDQISLSVEESKVAQLILEAKELSIATYSTSVATCGYGVHFDYHGASSTYTLFEYDSATPARSGGREICPSIASTTDPANGNGIEQYEKIYTSGSYEVHVAPGVAMLDEQGSDTIQDVLFYPPNPCTLISLDGQTFLDDCTGAPNGPPAESYVYLSTVDGSEFRTISVSPAGQVSL
jgi:prepilin-type N-terminal cleavage/methylation domain-containing protein